MGEVELTTVLLGVAGTWLAPGVVVAVAGCWNHGSPLRYGWRTGLMMVGFLVTGWPWFLLDAEGRQILRGAFRP